MILTDIDDNARTGTIVLRPNRSWSWRANVIFLSIFIGISLSISIGFLLAGAWVIMPFSLLEITVVGLCLHYCVKQCSRQEVITVSEYEVRLERGIRQPIGEQTFQRMWAKFLVQQPRRPWQDMTLSIQSHGEETEIGSFLNRRDKVNLITQLKRVVPE